MSRLPNLRSSTSNPGYQVGVIGILPLHEEFVLAVPTNNVVACHSAGRYRRDPYGIRMLTAATLASHHVPMPPPQYHSVPVQDGSADPVPRPPPLPPVTNVPRVAQAPPAPRSSSHVLTTYTGSATPKKATTVPTPPSETSAPATGRMQRGGQSRHPAGHGISSSPATARPVPPPSFSHHQEHNSSPDTTSTDSLHHRTRGSARPETHGAKSDAPVAGPHGPLPTPDSYDAIVLVRYKRTSSAAVYKKDDLPDLAVGDLVIVTGDRGEHVATVSKLGIKKFKTTPATVLRFAHDADRKALDELRADEAEALAACCERVRQLGLDSSMRIVDVEFQMDRQKLTVFFAPVVAGGFVDFRALQRVLYQYFRCRIWIVDV